MDLQEQLLLVPSCFSEKDQSLSIPIQAGNKFAFGRIPKSFQSSRRLGSVGTMLTIQQSPLQCASNARLPNRWSIMALTVREDFNPAAQQFDRNNLTERYENLRYDLLAAVEGVRSRPYYDSEGFLSIGIGFNLTDSAVLDLVLEALGVPV